jgi:hypothetical protein
MNNPESSPKNDRLIFITKILVASALISIAIKAIGPLLHIQATSLSATLLVCSPVLIVAIILGIKTFFKG